MLRLQPWTSPPCFHKRQPASSTAELLEYPTHTKAESHTPTRVNYCGTPSGQQQPQYPWKSKPIFIALGLSLCMFPVGLDNTFISSAIPKITSDITRWRWCSVVRKCLYAHSMCLPADVGESLQILHHQMALLRLPNGFWTGLFDMLCCTYLHCHYYGAYCCQNRWCLY